MKRHKRRLEILTEKNRLFDDLLALTDKQTFWIKEENWKRLHNVIEAKKNRIKKIDQLDLLLDKLISIGEDHDDLETVNINKAIEEKAQSIIKKEQDNIKMIEDIMMVQKLELRQLQIKKKVNKAYSNQQNHSSGYYIDKFK